MDRSTKTEKQSAISKLMLLSGGWNAAFTIILLIIAFIMVVPMLLVVIVSLSSEISIASNGYSFFPSEWSLDGYKYLMKMGDQIRDSYIVTIAFTLIGTALSLAIMAMYSYVIAQRSFKFSRFFTWILFFTMLFSGGLVPSYILNTRYLHINDSIWIFILPSLVNVFNVIILRTFLRTTVPDTLYDAAKIDGAGHFTIFFRIVLPLFKAGLATVALFTLVGKWNDWFTGMLYINNPKLVPLQTLLTKLQNNIDFLKKNAAIGGTPDGIAMLRSLPDQNLRMSCTIIVVLPILFAYPFFQRYFVQGLTVGSIKE